MPEASGRRRRTPRADGARKGAIPSAQSLKGQVALVTGAGVRVGRAIATALADAGCAVVVHHHRSARPAAALVRSLVDRGGAACSVQADLGVRGEPERVVREALAWRGRLDLLVNSAAAFERRAFVDIDDDALERMLAVNLLAPFRLTRAAVPALTRRRGLVVNILDVAAFHAWRGYAHYGAAKAGLAMLTRILAVELAPRVRVCGIAPGTVAFPPDYDPEARRRVVANIPLGRVGRPEDVAQAVLYLANAPYVTGSVIAVDGGRLAGSRGLL